MGRALGLGSDHKETSRTRELVPPVGASKKQHQPKGRTVTTAITSTTTTTISRKGISPRAVRSFIAMAVVALVMLSGTGTAFAGGNSDGGSNGHTETGTNDQDCNYIIYNQANVTTGARFQTDQGPQIHTTRGATYRLSEKLHGLPTPKVSLHYMEHMDGRVVKMDTNRTGTFNKLVPGVAGQPNLKLNFKVWAKHGKYHVSPVRLTVKSCSIPDNQPGQDCGYTIYNQAHVTVDGMFQTRQGPQEQIVNGSTFKLSQPVAGMDTAEVSVYYLEHLDGRAAQMASSTPGTYTRFVPGRAGQPQLKLSYTVSKVGSGYKMSPVTLTVTKCKLRGLVPHPALNLKVLETAGSMKL